MFIVTEGMETVANCSHLSSTDGATILLEFSPYASLLMPIMWKFS